MEEYRRFSLRQHDGVTIVQLRDDKLMADDMLQELATELSKLVASERPRKLLFSCTAVRFLASAALGRLIVLGRETADVGGRVRLCNLRPEIRRVFTITKLDELLPISDDEDGALAAFAE